MCARRARLRRLGTARTDRGSRAKRARRGRSAALNELTQRTSLSDNPWACGIEARSRALMTAGQDAEGLYQEAISQLSNSRMTVHLARAHLIYGEWLRRQNRRADAREQLRIAHQMLTSMGADGFAERAARELRATGERVRNRTTESPAQLTNRETQIARLAAGGMSNPDIASQLFMSPRTVEYHLHKIFAKFNITSRKDLHHALPGPEGAGMPSSMPVDRSLA